MKLFFSGWQSTNSAREQAVLDAGYIRDRCFSFGILSPMFKGFSHCPGMVQAYELAKKHKLGIMMDSGAVSYRAVAMKHTKNAAKLKLPNERDFIEAYVAFCKQGISSDDKPPGPPNPH